MQMTRTWMVGAVALAVQLGASSAWSHGAAGTAFEDVSEPRLIETAPGVQKWATPAEMAELKDEAHKAGHCGGYKDVTDFIGEPEFEPADYSQLLKLGRLEPKFPREVNALLQQLSSDVLNNIVQALSSFQTRHYQSDSGVQAAHWIRDQFNKLTRYRSDTKATLYNHQRWRQPSVVARIEGNGQRAAERVVLGAHLDSIRSGFGGGVNAEAPGADDDASGVATLLEVYRVLALSGYRPERTIDFIAYAAEEVGLRGSQEIARGYRANNIPVVAAVQFDMTMHPGRSPAIALIEDYTNPELTQFARQLIETYVKIPWVNSRCGYGCSDHASWHALGYPAVFPFESPFSQSNKRIHTANDKLEFLDAGFGLHFAKLGVALAVELGGVFAGR